MPSRSARGSAETAEILRDLAESQGALRRVATLVAQGAEPQRVFDAIVTETSGLLGVEAISILSYDADTKMCTMIAHTHHARTPVPIGAQWPVDTGSPLGSLVIRTGRPGRIDDWTRLPGFVAARHRDEGFGPAVGAPIIVDGAIWGHLAAFGEAGEVLPQGCETRLAGFTQLVASSISNAHARNNLIASRARIVTASDETRRRVERNLHDGIQQRVVALSLSLRAVRAGFPLPPEAQAELDEVARDLEALLEEIRVFSRGLHPALLSSSGLGPALRALARRSPIPVSLQVAGVPRPPEPVETAVYYVVSEALANAAKHSRASEVSVTVACDAALVRARVADDGVGGATVGHSSGLIGLVDRVEALGGKFVLESPAGTGTTISIELPLDSQTVGERPAPRSRIRG